MTDWARAVWFVTLLSVLFGGCFDPAPVRCLRCIDSCPTGQHCMDGICQTRPNECALGADTSVCGETCCIDGACFDLKRHMPPDSLALWLDWTSLYESNSSEAKPSPIWRDRSARAYSFTQEESEPTLVSSPDLQRNVLRLSSEEDQRLVLGAQQELTLEHSDFLLMAAASLSCTTTKLEAKQCPVARIDEGAGLRLCASLGSREPSQITTRSKNAEDKCFSALVAGVACNEMQLFTLRRFTPDSTDAGSVASQFELRNNAVTQASLELDPSWPQAVVSPLRIGGRGMFSFAGDIAFVALIIGRVEARERCELERFVLEQLAAADLPTTAELPDCSGL